MRLTAIVLVLATCTGEESRREAPRREATRPSAAVDPSRPSRALVRQHPDEPDEHIQPCPPPDPAATPDLPRSGRASISAPGPAVAAPQPGPPPL